MDWVPLYRQGNSYNYSQTAYKSCQIGQNHKILIISGTLARISSLSEASGAYKQYKPIQFYIDQMLYNLNKKPMLISNFNNIKKKI